MKSCYFLIRFNLVLVACCLLIVSGCGKSGGEGRYNLSGKVTYQGKPLPNGSIIFEPDASKENDGPQGMTVIKNGHYSTDEVGRGAISGPLIVRIRGQMEPDNGGEASEKPFLTYTTTIDLPKETSTFDFEMFDDKQKK